MAILHTPESMGHKLSFQLVIIQVKTYKSRIVVTPRCTKSQSICIMAIL